MQQAFHTTYSSYTRGVAILLSKSLVYKVIHVCSDPEGRFIILVLELGTMKYVFVNVYIPPPFSRGIFYTIQEKLAPLQLARVICARDFNSVLQANFNVHISQRTSSVEIQVSSGSFLLTLLRLT